MIEKKAVIYCRVSTEDQAENGTSLETQELACLRKAAEMGAPVIGPPIRDEGISGGLYAARPGIQAAIEAVETGGASVLIVYSISRLSRDVEHQQAIKKRVERAGGRIVICDMPMEDTEEGELMFGISGTFAQYERRLIRKRTVTGCRRLAEKGIQPSRGRAPFGYDLITERHVMAREAEPGTEGTYRLNPLQAPTVREIFARYSAGASTRGITEWLNREGVPTPKSGELWRPRTIIYMLENPIYRGQATYGRFELITDENRRAERGLKTTRFQRERESGPLFHINAPALVDEATWHLCQKRRVENKTAKSGNPGRVYLLSGIARCPVCNRGLAGRTSGHYKHYRCNRIESTAHRKEHYAADRMESDLTELLCMVEARPDRIGAALTAFHLHRQSARPIVDVDAIRRELEELDKREKTTARAQVEAMMSGRSTEVYDGLLAELDKQRQAVKARLMAAETTKRTHGPTDPTAATITTKEAIAALRKVLTASDVLTTSERREAIAGFVKELYPIDQAGGIRVQLRPTDETVQFGVVIYHFLPSAKVHILPQSFADSIVPLPGGSARSPIQVSAVGE